MNELQEFTSTLDLNLDIEEKKRLIREWKEINKWDSAKLVKGTDVANQGAIVTSTNVDAPEVKNTDLNSSDGISPPLDRAFIDRIVNEEDFKLDLELIPERKGKDRAVSYTEQTRPTTPKEIIKVVTVRIKR